MGHQSWPNTVLLCWNEHTITWPGPPAPHTHAHTHRVEVIDHRKSLTGVERRRTCSSALCLLFRDPAPGSCGWKLYVCMCVCVMCSEEDAGLAHLLQWYSDKISLSVLTLAEAICFLQVAAMLFWFIIATAARTQTHSDKEDERRGCSCGI